MAEAAFCPYVGLRPYDEADRAYFFGREREVRSVADSLFGARVTVFYGASGVGKSSVLMAGVVPELRAEPRTAVVVFRNWQIADAVAQLKAEIAATADGVAGRPLDLDATLPLDELLKQAAEGIDGTVLLILDQFEEFFLYFKDPEAGFDAELARALTRRDVDAGFVISLREDSLSKLDRLKRRVPNLLANTLRLSHLRIGAAGRAIGEPLAEYNRRRPEAAAEQDKVSIEPALTHAVLAQTAPGQLSLAAREAPRDGEVEEGRVEAPFLQLVMERLWNEEISQGSRVLRLQTLERLGGAETIVRTHLNEVLAGLAPDDQELCARIFDRLVTPSGAKIAVKRGDLASYASEFASRLPPLIRFLENNRILARIPAPAGALEDDDQYQIFHDVLAAGFIDWRERYLRTRVQAAAEAEAAERARAAIEAERQRSEEQRRQVESEVRARELQAARERAAQESRLRKRFQFAAAFAGLMALVALVMVWQTIGERRKAEDAATAERTAKDAAQRAQAVLLVDRIRETYERTNDHEAALAALQPVLDQLDSKSAAAYALRGQVRLDQGLLMRTTNRRGDPVVTAEARQMLDGALADFDRSLELDHRQPAVLAARAGVRLAKDDLKGALADYDAAIKISSSDPALVLDRGRLRARANDLEGALADYSRAIALDAGFAAAYLERADLLRRSGKLAEARQDLQAAARYASDDQTRLLAAQRLRELGGPLLAAAPPASQTVFIHYVGTSDADRNAAEAVKRALERDFRVAGVQAVPGGRSNGDVRYFVGDDRDQAARDERVAANVAREVETTLAQAGYNVRLQTIMLDAKRFPDAKPGTIEVWLPPLRQGVPQLPTSRALKSK